MKKIKDLLLIGLIMVCVLNDSVVAAAKPASEMSHGEVIEQFISDNVLGEDISYERADKFLSKLEEYAALRMILNTEDGYIKSEFKKDEDLNLSHAQELNILDYLKTYGEKHDKLDKDEDFKEMREVPEFSLKDDWYLKSPRSKEIPQALWPFMSTYSANRKIVLEPVFMMDQIVSGYTAPNQTVTIKTETYGFDHDNNESFEVVSDETGRFEIKVDSIVFQSKISVYGLENIEDVHVFQYKPTALEHPSGKLKLERFFMGQSVLKGKTLPNTTIRIAPANGYGTSAFEVGQSDPNGNFQIDNPLVVVNEKRLMLKVFIQDKETGETIEVVPYPWTEEEFARVKW